MRGLLPIGPGIARGAAASQSRPGAQRSTPFEAVVDGQRRGQPARSPRQVERPDRPPPRLHQGDAFRGSSARISTPAPTPAASLETLHISEVP